MLMWTSVRKTNQINKLKWSHTALLYVVLSTFASKLLIGKIIVENVGISFIDHENVILLHQWKWRYELKYMPFS